MHIAFRDKRDGIITEAYFERHTMSRTIRRYPSRHYDMVRADLSGRCAPLVRLGKLAMA